MKSIFRGFVCLLFSLLFHFIIFLCADISMLPARSASHEQTRIIAEVVLFPVPIKHTGMPEGQVNNTENEEIALTRYESGTEPQIITEEIILIEPHKAPEAEKAVEQKKTPEAAKAAEPQKAPEPIIASEPEKAPEPVKAVEPQKAPEPVKASEPKKTPEPVKAIEPQRAPVRTQPSSKVEPPKNTTSNTTESITHNRQASNTDKTDTSRSGNISSSVQEEPSPKPGVPARSHSQPQSVPAIAGVDSVIVVNRVSPVYPQISRRRGEEGNVVLLAIVENGKVVSVSVEKSSGIKALDSSALSAVGKWSFSPDTNITVRIPVAFKLKD